MDEQAPNRGASGFAILSDRMEDMERHLRDVGSRVHAVEVDHGARLSVLEDKSCVTTARLEEIYTTITAMKTETATVQGRVESMLAAHVADEEKALRNAMMAIIAVLVSALGGLILQVISMLHT